MTDLEIAAFVEARIADDEAAAEAATPGRWVVGGFPGAEYLPCDFVHAPDYRPEGFSEGQHVGDASVADGGMGPWAASVRGSGFPRANATHIARHDPAAVLREVEARRERLQLLRIAWNAYQDSQRSHEPFEAFARGDACGRFVMALRMVALDAAIWRDHPDYRSQWADPGWRPTMAGSRPA